MGLTGAVNAGTIAAHLRLDSTLEKDGAKARKSIGLVTGALVGATVAAGALALAFSAKVGKGVIEAGSYVEDMRGKFDAVFKETADDVEEWADTFGDAVGRSRFELMGLASSLQDTFVPMKFTREEGAELSKQLVELAVDLNSFNVDVISDKAAMEDLQSAIVGNHETMRKYGVIITQTTLNQKLLTMGVKGGTNAATEQEKAQARFKLIMEGTNDAQGDAVRTSGSLANMQRKLKSTMSEMMGEAGRDELPEMTKVLEDFDAWGQAGGYENVQGFFSDVAAATTIAAKGMSEFVKQVTFIYSFYADKYDEIQDDLAEGREQVAISMLESNKNISDDTREKLEANLRMNETWVGSILDIEVAQTRLAKTSGETTDDIVEDAKTVQAAFDDTTIPDWAGQSDYIRSQLAASGITPESVDELGKSTYNVASLWSREQGNVISGVPSVSPTITAGAPQATAAGGSVSMLATINRSIQEGNDIQKEVISAIGRISMGGGGGFIGAGGADMAGKGAGLPPNVHANMKKTYDLSGLSSLRF